MGGEGDGRRLGSFLGTGSCHFVSNSVLFILIKDDIH
jgi:hypothetical protein